MQDVLERALELIDRSIRWAQRTECPDAIRGLCRLRKTVCDSYFGENEYASDNSSMLRDFDQFALDIGR